MTTTTTRDRIRETLQQSPATPAQLRDKTGLSLKCLGKALLVMHAVGEAHRGGWTARAAIWHAGPGVDAPKPAAVVRLLAAQERAREARWLHKTRQFLAVDRRSPLERCLCPDPGLLPATRYLAMDGVS